MNKLHLTVSSSGRHLGRVALVVLISALPLWLTHSLSASDLVSAQDIQKSEKAHEWYGEVRFYQTDETITIAKSPTSEVKYDLADKKVTYKIDPAVKTGSKVRVLEQEQSDGKRLVSITLRRE